MKQLGISDIKNAQEKISSTVTKTPVLNNTELDEQLGGYIFFKCENFQRTGSFKLRGSYNAISNLSEGNLKHGVATHSSGNHGQALALAAKLKGVPAYIVMPRNAPRIKKRAVEDYGAQITLCGP